MDRDVALECDAHRHEDGGAHRHELEEGKGGGAIQNDIKDSSNKHWIVQGSTKRQGPGCVNAGGMSSRSSKLQQEQKISNPGVCLFAKLCRNMKLNYLP